MAELYLISVVFILIAGMLSHDRSVIESNRQSSEWFKVYGAYGVEYYQNNDYTSTTFTTSGTS